MSAGERDYSAEFDAEESRLRDTDEVFALREALRDSNERLRKEKDKTVSLAEAVERAAKSALLMQPRQKVKPPKSLPGGKGKPEVALAHLTDWQGAKVTESYSSAVMRDRVHLFVDKMLSITAMARAAHPVDDAVVMLGGDMIEGIFNFPTQPYEIDATLFDQFTTVASLLDDVCRRLAQEFNTVRVVPEWGNHGRLGSRHSAVKRSDNADRMTYRLAKEMSKDLTNVSWEGSVSGEADREHDIQRVQIGNYRALLMHGDEVGRNGFASPMTIVRHANQWASGAFPWAFRDVYVGHYHTHNEWAMANGRGTVYQSGSTESDNHYARETMAASAIPSQRLHFVEPVAGLVTSQYKILLA